MGVKIKIYIVKVMRKGTFLAKYAVKAMDEDDAKMKAKMQIEQDLRVEVVPSVDEEIDFIE